MTETNKINLGEIQLPLNSATKSFAILAKRGAGKSYTADVMAEEFYKVGIPFVIFDPIDIHWGLKLKNDGKTKGLPIVVFGLEHADIQLDRDMGKRIAQAVVKHNISCVISTFGMPKTAQRHLIAEFSEEILNINNTPRHIFIEEAHEFVPQRVFGEVGKTFNAVSNLVVMGRNRGLGVTLINQRASTVNKDVLTQLDTLIALRNVAPQDRRALKEWVEFHSAEGDFDLFMKSLPSLPTGEAWIWSPEFLKVFKRIKIRERETFHPDREKIGDKFIMPEIEATDISTFISEFEQTHTVASGKKSKDAFIDKSNDRCPICNRKTVGLTGYCRKHFTMGQKQVEPAIKLETQMIASMKNEYESKLIEKDLEIRKRDEIINKIRGIVGVSGQQSIIPIKSSNVDMWIEKFGNRVEAKIIKFLSEHSTEKFTREQLALALGMSYKSISNTAVPNIKRALVVKEEGGKLFINPTL